MCTRSMPASLVPLSGECGVCRSEEYNCGTLPREKNSVSVYATFRFGN